MVAKDAFLHQVWLEKPKTWTTRDLERVLQGLPEPFRSRDVGYFAERAFGSWSYGSGLLAALQKAGLVRRRPVTSPVTTRGRKPLYEWTRSDEWTDQDREEARKLAGVL